MARPPITEEEEARARADAVLAAADAAGRPLLDPCGRRRSPITVGQYRRGRKAPNAGKRYPIEVLTAGEVAALLKSLPKGRTGVRDAALIVLLWRGGLRIAEALALEPKDLVMGDGTVAILRGKGARRRTIALDPVATSYIERWLRVRSELGAGDDALVFCTTRNDGGAACRPLKDQVVRQMLKRYARRAGIRKRVAPHGLRHTNAYDLAMEGVPLPLIRAQLGHASLAMTQHYVDHLAPTTLVNALREREWPAELLPPTPPSISAALSQDAPGPAPALGAVPAVVDPLLPEPIPVTDRGAPAVKGEAHQRTLDVLAANGGRVTQPQLARALGVTKGRVSQLVKELHSAGLIIEAGFHRDPVTRGARARVWRLTPPKAKLTLDVHDPRERALPVARRGYGPQRVLAVIEGLNGRASQAQIARELGINSETAGVHCRALEAQGKLTRAGLDKTTSNRGSQVWRLGSPRSRYQPAGGYSRRFAVSRSTIDPERQH